MVAMTPRIEPVYYAKLTDANGQAMVTGPFSTRDIAEGALGPLMRLAKDIEFAFLKSEIVN